MYANKVGTSDDTIQRDLRKKIGYLTCQKKS